MVGNPRRRQDSGVRGSRVVIELHELHVVEVCGWVVVTIRKKWRLFQPWRI
jgi:hypothetical protein